MVYIDRKFTNDYYNRYITDPSVVYRDNQLKSEANKYRKLPYIKSNLNSYWENTIDSIIRQKDVKLISTEPYENDISNTITITLRGTYQLGRSVIVRQMLYYDKRAVYATFNDHPYVCVISPLFKTVITGIWYADKLMPYNGLDLIPQDEYKVNKYLDYISEIYEHPELKGYNFIFEGNKFQPYLNRMKNHAEQHGRERYIDLYIVNDDMYDYLTGPVQSCYFRRYGWNKYPVHDQQYCKIFDNLKNSVDVGIETWGLRLESGDDMLRKLMFGDLLDMKHYMNKPLI